VINKKFISIHLLVLTRPSVAEINAPRDNSTASHELIARRMLECSPAVIITIIDQGRITFRRGNFPGRVPPPSKGELLCWRQVHEQKRPHEKADGLNTIKCWPVHEHDWKREIIRLEMEAEDEYF
jgi:hypothetical protein